MIAKPLKPRFQQFRRYNLLRQFLTNATRLTGRRGLFPAVRSRRLLDDFHFTPFSASDFSAFNFMLFYSKRLSAQINRGLTDFYVFSPFPCRRCRQLFLSLILITLTLLHLILFDSDFNRLLRFAFYFQRTDYFWVTEIGYFFC